MKKISPKFRNKMLYALCSSAFILGNISLQSLAVPPPSSIIDFEKEIKNDNTITDEQKNKIIASLRTGESFNISIVSDIAYSALNSAMDDLTNRFKTLNNKFENIAAGDPCLWGTNGAQYGLWTSGIYTHAKQKSRAEIPGHKSNSFGGTVGADTLISEGNTIGIAGTFLKNKITLKDQKSGDQNKINSYILSLYAKQEFNDFFVQEIISAAHHTNKNSEKRFNIEDDEPVYEKANSKFKIKSYGAQILAGVDVRQDNIIITPMLGARFMHNKHKVYNETGKGDLNLKVSIKQKHTIEGILGLKLGMITALDCGFSVIPEVHASLYHNFKNKSFNVTREFLENTDYRNTRSVNLQKTLYKMGLGLNLSKDNTQYGINYDATIAKKYLAHQGSLRVRINF